MKKIEIIIVSLLITLVGEYKVYANTSESFLKVLSLMKTPVYNVNGLEINELVYQNYHLFCYGNPGDIVVGQRWKDTESGKWINEKTGKKGEYRILGYNASGGIVNNEWFPDDSVSGISPEEWNYITIKDAISSWNETEKYCTQKQIQYMSAQPWIRNGEIYSLTAQKVGLEKARIENYATWKSAGSIFTLKQNSDGRIWEATFHIPPMAADAELVPYIQFPQGTKYTFEEGQDILTIPYSFGVEVTHLGEYASLEDIEELASTLEINYETKDKLAESNVSMVSKDNTITIRKSDYPNGEVIKLLFCNTAVLTTCFQSEAPMVAMLEVEIEIVLSPKEEEKYIAIQDENQIYAPEVVPPDISFVELYRKSALGVSQKVPLWIAKKTNIPFISAGQVLVVEAMVSNEPDSVIFAIEGDSSIQTLDALTQKFLYEEPKERNEKKMFSSLYGLKNAFHLPKSMEKQSDIYTIEYVIPYGTKQSIHSWSTLREEKGSAMQIEKEKLMSRIRMPYRLKIVAQNAGGIVTKSISLDVFERWDTIYNRDLKEYVK